LAKAFDHSCPLSPFVPAAQIADPLRLALQLQINGEVRQEGITADMMLAIPELLAYISTFFTLLPGDVVLTGTPAGVGLLQPGDQLLMTLAGEYRFQAVVA
jgi:2-keto-4-pentenoate hydratase/2-oxohepta-3-ene-1,7-dioic acid hydratase in catechol pathway